MEEICKEIPCRNEQINELFNLLNCDEDEPLPCALYISGNVATGKTLCIETILRHLGYKYVTVSCISCYKPRIMYETILSGLGDDETNVKCHTLLDLVDGLNRIQESLERFEPRVIIIDKAERLQTMNPNIICTLLRLRQLCNMNVCTIFVTHKIYDYFYFKIAIREPIRLYFPNYNKEELFRIIFSDHDTFYQRVIGDCDVVKSIQKEISNPELFANFLNAFLSVFYRPCCNLLELKHMALMNFAKYCEPIIKNEIQANDISKLWRHISPILKSNLKLMYLHGNSINVQNDSSNKENDNNLQGFTIGDTFERETLTKISTSSFELPYYSKFLLISAYIASYNPPNQDKRLFVKNHGKQRKRMQHVRAKAKVNERLNTQLGPKVFSLDRLLAIFYSILDEKIDLSSSLLAQITTLMRLKLIVGKKEIDLNTAKYKCIVDIDFISEVAKTVGFNIRKYLCDFI